MKKLLITLIIICAALSANAELIKDSDQWSVSGTASVMGFMANTDHVNFDGRESHEFKLLGDLEVNAQYKPNDNWELNATATLGNYMNMIKINPYDDKNTITPNMYYYNAKYKSEGFGEMRVGSFGKQIHPYIFMRSTNDWYFSNNRFGSGDFQMLGIDWKNKIGNFDYDVWYGRLGKNGFSDEDIFTHSYALGKIKDYYGGKVAYDFNPVKLSALYSQATSDLDDDAKSKIYGAWVNVPTEWVNFDANYIVQKTDDMDKAKMWDVKLSRDFGKLSAGASYIHIDEGYNAAGDWVFYSGNNSGVKGAEFDLGYKFSDKFNINGYIQTGKSFVTDLDAKVMRSQWNFNYIFDDANSLTFTWRNRHKKYDDFDNVYHNWFILKYKHAFSDQLNFLLGYENFHYNNHKFYTTAGDDKGTSGAFFTQLSYSF